MAMRWTRSTILVVLAVVLVLAVAGLAFGLHARAVAAQEDRARVERLSDALRRDGDPGQLEADKIEALVEQMKAEQRGD